MPASPQRIARQTSQRVYRRDRIAEAVIRAGGAAVLVAVLGICVYLAMVVLPLFRGGSPGASAEVHLEGASDVLAAQLDEYNRAILLLGRDGALRAIHLPSGASLGEAQLRAAGDAPSALSTWSRDGRIALGYPDGSLQVGSIRFRSRLRIPDPSERDIPVGESRPAPQPGKEGWTAVVERVGEEQVRETTPVVEFAQPAKLTSGEGAVRRIGAFADDRSQIVVALRDRGPASYSLLRITQRLGGGAPRISLSTFPFEMQPAETPPDWLFVTGDGKHILALWQSGDCQRYAAPDPRSRPIVFAETRTLSQHPIMAATMLLGARTLVLGDDAGGISAWFAAPDPAAGTPDQQRLVHGHQFAGPGGPVTSLATSWRDRSILIGDRAGRAMLRHVSSEKQILRAAAGVDSPVVAGAIAPKNDALALLYADGTLAYSAYTPGYPEITLQSLFAPMHYEGQAESSFVYQSSAGDDAAEAKLSLTPLVFGTLKATVVAMLFACPLAVFAAIYSSEFLSSRLRRTVKPAIEMMASLPSVVLGFIAAMVVAPFAREMLPSLLLAGVALPLVILTGAGVWAALPNRFISRYGRRAELGMIAGCLLLGLALSGTTGPLIERALFRATPADLLMLGGSFEPVDAADIPAWVGVRETMSPDEERRLRRVGMYFRDGAVVRPVEPDAATMARIRQGLTEHGLDRPGIERWLNSEIGGPWPGWFAVCVPLGAIGAVPLSRRVLRSRKAATSAPGAEVLRALLSPVFCVLATVLFASLCAWVLTLAGLDARDSILGTFSPRNTLVVGLIMGVAIIPIIYTISEDALSSVPNTLRAASLGAGASRWQTAVRVVLPVAASGIFSAAMIGLGRAVGETMIVLMATGNTPTMNLNIFEGFRTLAANIAVELPEAPKGEALYRVLFVCGLVLFLMTFVINTTAEVVRQRYRKKNALL